MNTFIVHVRFRIYSSFHKQYFVAYPSSDDVSSTLSNYD